jgi:hypothetical protein
MSYNLIARSFFAYKFILNSFINWLVFAGTTYYPKGISREIRSSILVNHYRRLHNFSVRWGLGK